MIVVTGAAGFIGSCLISKLNSENFNYIVAVDDFSDEKKNKNLEGKKILHKVDRNDFFDWIEKSDHGKLVEFILHIGARTDTSEFDKSVFDELNVAYSKKIWHTAVKHQIPLIYASSAATYGLGEHGYEDKEDIISSLQPLNPYGDSKNEFDRWAIQQEKKPFFWAGLKFFNVYGPNEYHKGRMASVIWHAYNQIKAQGQMKLFRSHRSDIKDGEQSRDFVYVKDVINIIYFLIHQRKHSGIYNIGTGQARSFLDLTKSTFAAMNKAENISFIDTPQDIRDKYQYFTEANIAKLRAIGYQAPFFSLEEGVKDYVENYLIPMKYL